jgi:hypothetical protein
VNPYCRFYLVVLTHFETLSLVLTVKTSEQVMHGLGRHESELSKNERLTFLNVGVVLTAVLEFLTTEAKKSQKLGSVSPTSAIIAIADRTHATLLQLRGHGYTANLYHRHFG